MFLSLLFTDIQSGAKIHTFNKQNLQMGVKKTKEKQYEHDYTKLTARKAIQK